MSALELKVPPPLVALLLGVGMWWLAHNLHGPALPVLVGHIMAAVCLTAGLGIALIAELSFLRARTTANPLTPHRTATLVTNGVYRFSRNPMYVGVVLVLLAWALWLSNLWVFPGPLLFALYITRFQIVPEEHLLRAKFGADYSIYMTRTRRWV